MLWVYTSSGQEYERRTTKRVEKWWRERRRELNSPRFLPRSTDLLLPSREASKIFKRALFYVFPRATTRKLLTRCKVEHFHFFFFSFYFFFFFFTRFICHVALIFPGYRSLSSLIKTLNKNWNDVSNDANEFKISIAISISIKFWQMSGNIISNEIHFRPQKYNSLYLLARKCKNVNSIAENFITNFKYWSSLSNFLKWNVLSLKQLYSSKGKRLNDYVSRKLFVIITSVCISAER